MRIYRDALLLCCFLLCASVAQGAAIVLPSGAVSAEGNSNSSIPFNTNVTAISLRYQQVFAATEFPAGPHLITRMAFRPDAQSSFAHAFSTTLSDIQINFSTTHVGVDGLSLTAADNVGDDDTVVHVGPLALSSDYLGPTGGPKLFDIVVNFQTPFVYDPSLGNLLLDVRSSSGEGTVPFDAVSEFNDSVSRLWAFSTPSMSDLRTDTGGLVTQFTLTTIQIPEPAALLAWVLVGLTGMGYRCWWTSTR